jgi:hypothetical protein
MAGFKRKASHQRCAVRVTYSRNTVKGQWRAHGRYVGRDSATDLEQVHSPGFDGKRVHLDMSTILDGWQRAGDERLWKLIISPEFGERIDLVKLTRELLASMSQQLKRPIEWAAVAHYNTEHPHVHVALRGMDGNGEPLRLDRDYIKCGIRAVAEDLCTRQLGHRTERDATEASAREVRKQRYTSLDREISRFKNAAVDSNTGFVATPGSCGVSRRQYLAERLMFLEKAGLSTKSGPNSWQVRNDFENVLRAMQWANDRQKTMAAHGVLMSDQRLPFALLDLRTLRSAEGRVLVHGEEEDGRDAGRRYLLLEGTDARVYYVPYAPEIETARNEGRLGTNSFIRLRKIFVGGKPALEAEDFGPAEAILRNRQHLDNAARAFISRGIIPTDDGWAGWLGRYQAAVRQRSMVIERDGLRRPDGVGRVR